jgi:hypothetical protein
MFISLTLGMRACIVRSKESSASFTLREAPTVMSQLASVSYIWTQTIAIDSC